MLLKCRKNKFWIENITSFSCERSVDISKLMVLSFFKNSLISFKATDIVSDNFVDTGDFSFDVDIVLEPITYVDPRIA